uniref:Uncharacterized protein n=1 Tax=Myotis myotis TaxID=51298 RepID=A0A7J7ZXK7_MYOMY|nr:hypothetical protein mMyoMyo1_009902 [Myotis myotis]
MLIIISHTRGLVQKNLCTRGVGGSLSPACALSQSGTPREITTCWLRPAPGWQRAGPIPRCSPWSGSEQGRLGSWGADPCHAQSRADWEVAMPPSVTLRVGPIWGLGHRPLSHTEQGPSRGWGAAPCHTQSRRAIRGLGSSPYQAQIRANQGLGRLTLSQTEQGG